MSLIQHCIDELSDLNIAELELLKRELEDELKRKREQHEQSA